MVKIGTQFRHHYADGNCLWTVVEKRGRGTWIAEINADELDYAGTQDAFTTEQIIASVNWTKAMNKSGNDSDKFFNSLKPGSVVHYHNGFNQYVRCQVTSKQELLPIALVGDWKEYDLPKRQSDGTVYLGYHAGQITAGKTFRPHASNMWEYRGARQTGDIDPTTLVPLSLEVPKMNPKQALEAAKHQKLNAIRALLQDANAEPDDIFDRLKILLQSA
jgi:hypothetical protein